MRYFKIVTTIFFFLIIISDNNAKEILRFGYGEIIALTCDKRNHRNIIITPKYLIYCDEFTGEITDRFDFSFENITGASCSPSGELLALSYDNGTIAVLNLTTRLLTPQYFALTDSEINERENHFLTFMIKLNWTPDSKKVICFKSINRYVSGIFSYYVNYQVWNYFNDSVHLTTDKKFYNRNDLTFSSDGLNAIIFSKEIGNNEVKICDIYSGDLIKVYEIKDNIIDVEMDSERNKLYIANLNKIKVIDSQTGLEFENFSQNWFYSIHDLLLSPDGKKILVRCHANISYENYAKIFDTETSKELVKLDGTLLNSLNWQQNGNIITGKKNNSICYWNSNTGIIEKNIPGFCGYIWDISWNMKNEFIAAVDNRNGISFWNPNSGQALLPFDINIITSDISFSPDGNRLMISGSSSANYRNSIDILNLQNKKNNRIIWNRQNISHIEGFPNDTNLIATYGSGILIWDIKKNNYQSNIDFLGTLFKLSPDGNKMATCTTNDDIFVWDLESDTLITFFQQDKLNTYFIDWLSNEKIVTISNGYEGNTINIWDLANSKLLNSILVPYSNVLSDFFVKNNIKKVAIGTYDYIDIINMERGESIKRIMEKGGLKHSLSWNSDGSKLAYSVSEDTSVSIVDVNSGEILYKLKSRYSQNAKIFWSFDDSRLVIISTFYLSGEGQKVNFQIINTNSWNEVAYLEFNNDSRDINFDKIAINPKKNYLAFNHYLIDLINGTSDLIDISLYSKVNSLAWSTTGNRLFVGSDNNIMILDLGSQIFIATKNNHKEIVEAEWLGNDKVITVEKGKRLIIWDIEKCTGIFQIDDVLDCSVSKNTQNIAICYGNDVMIYETKNFEVVNYANLSNFSEVKKIAVNHDATLLAISGVLNGSYTENIYIINLISGEEVKVLKSNSNFHKDIKWNPFYNYLAASSTDSTVKIWDVNTGNAIDTIYGDQMMNLDWSPDGEKIAISDRYGIIRIFGEMISSSDYSDDSNKIVFNLTISPNPATDYIEISCPPLSPGEGWGEGIRIFDLLGVEVIQGIDSRNRGNDNVGSGRGQIRIDVSSLSPGVYFVRVGNEVRKFVKM